MNKKTEKVILGIMVAIIALVGVYYAFGEKEIKQWKTNSTKRNQYLQKINDANLLDSKLAREKIKYCNNTNLMLKVDAKIMDKGNFTDFVQVVKDAADKSKIKILNIRPTGKGDIARADGYIERMIELEVKGVYPSIGDLINELLSDGKSIRITELKLEPDSKGIHTTQITLGFLVKKEI